CFQVFLNALSRKFARQDILLVLDGAPNHRCRDLVLPSNISLLFLPPYSPELNPKENLWEEIREKIFKNYALKSIDAVRAKLKQAIFYINCNPETVKSITSFPYIRKSFLMWNWYHTRQADQTRIAVTFRQEYAGHCCRCARRRSSRTPSHSD